MVQDSSEVTDTSLSSITENFSKVNMEEVMEDKATSTMTSFDRLPLEVKEVIFLYLSPRDLKQCSLVCMKWHDIVNSNRIWLKICALRGLSKKKYLEDSCSMIENPIKHYTFKNHKLSPSHWRSHFNRYRFVQRNWKEGYYVVSTLPMKPIHMNDHSIVEHIGNDLVISDVHGKVQKFCSIRLTEPESKVDTVVCKDDFLVYTQNRNVVCLKKDKKNYKEIINVILEGGKCSQPRSNCIKSQFTIRISNKFLLIQDPLNPCMLCFFETSDSSLRRRVDLHKALGNQSLVCSCLEVHGERVLLGYRMGSDSFIAQYDYSRDMWESPVLVVPSRPVELYLLERFIVSKLCNDSRDQHISQVSNLFVWSREPVVNIGEFCAAKHVPVLLAERDMMIYMFRDEVIVRRLSGTFEESFSVSSGLISISRVWDTLLVLHDEKGISVWDYTTGKKLVTPLRSDTCITACASDTNILLRCEDERFIAISFW